MGTVFNHFAPQHSLLQNGGNSGSYLEGCLPGFSLAHSVLNKRSCCHLLSSYVSSIHTLRSRVGSSSESQTSSPYPPPGGARSPRATKKPMTQVANQDNRSRGRPSGGEGYLSASARPAPSPSPRTLSRGPPTPAPPPFPPFGAPLHCAWARASCPRPRAWTG